MKEVPTKENMIDKKLEIKEICDDKQTLLKPSC